MILTAKGEETLRAAIGSDLRNLRALCHEPPPLELRRPLTFRAAAERCRLIAVARRSMRRLRILVVRLRPALKFGLSIWPLRQHFEPRICQPQPRFFVERAASFFCHATTLRCMLAIYVSLFMGVKPRRPSPI